jgi:hypothetical protein
LVSIYENNLLSDVVKVMDNYFMHGTQHRFTKDIVNKGLNNPNAAVFNIDQNCKYSDLHFTISVALYHAISIQVQDEILQKWYINLAGFYEKNNDKLPSIIYFWDSVKISDIDTSKIYKKLYIPENTYSYPYYKIDKIWPLTKIKNVLNTTLEDFISAEKWINEKIEEDLGRFFSSTWENVDGVIQDKKLENFKLISKNYMSEICYRLCDQLLNR